jgi:hypothetical protein
MLSSVSNISKVKANFAKYRGNDNAILKVSTKSGKKFMVIHDGRTTHFGDINLADFTKTGFYDLQMPAVFRNTQIINSIIAMIMGWLNFNIGSIFTCATICTKISGVIKMIVAGSFEYKPTNIINTFTTCPSGFLEVNLTYSNGL